MFNSIIDIDNIFDEWKYISITEYLTFRSSHINNLLTVSSYLWILHRS